MRSAAGPVPSTALARLVEQTSRRIHSAGYEADLFPAQWAALRYFSDCAPDDANASALARYQGLAYGPVTRTVRTLIEKGMVANTGPVRGRARRVALTQKGRRLLDKDPLNEVVSALESLGEVEREALAVALEAILRRLQARNAC